MEKDLSRAFVLSMVSLALVFIVGSGAVVQYINADDPLQFADNYVEYVMPDPEEIDHPGRMLFKTNCSVCHLVNEDFVGPALIDIAFRRDSAWIVKMVRNSSLLIASGDPIATQLYKDYNETMMPSFDFEEEEIFAIVDYIMAVPKPVVETNAVLQSRLD